MALSATVAAGYAPLTRPTPTLHGVVFAILCLAPYFASPSDFSALPLSSLSAFMNSPNFAESR